MSLVMVFGSFDPLHEGHRNLFSQAKAFGEVIVVLSRDGSIRRIKHREPRQGEMERLFAVAAEQDVKKAVLGNEDDFLAVVAECKPQVLLLGYDQVTFSEEELQEKLAVRGLHPEIRRAEAFEPQKYKSSKMSGEITNHANKQQ